jgi:hypothetical protein
MKQLFWTAYSNDERHLAITSIKDIVNQFGDMVDYKFFSDISINMTIEIEEYKINAMHMALSKIVSIDGFEPIDSKAKTERTIYMNVTFTKATGNLKIEVPEVPG